MTPAEQEAAAGTFNDYIKNNPNGTVPLSLNSAGDTNQYITKNGVLTTQSAQDLMDSQQAGVANGTMRNVGTASAPMTVPVGSAGDTLSKGLADGTVDPQNPQQQMAAALKGNNVNAPGITPISPDVSNLKAAFQAAKAAGVEAPQTTGDAKSMVTQFSNAASSAPTFYKPDPNSQQVYNAQGAPVSYDDFIAQGGKPDFSNVQNSNAPASNPTPLSGIEQQLAEDKGYQQLLADRAEYNSVANQSKSLLDFYNQAVKDSGIPAINAELINSKKIIEGTEDDIRNEVKAVSGFATDSQVLALSSARNKTLIKNYNALLDTKTMAMEQVNNMVNLAGQDRNFALQSVQQKLQIDQQINDYRDKFVNNAKEGFNNVIKAVGYSGLYDSLKNDPSSLAMAERTLGLQPGMIQGAAEKQAKQEAVDAQGKQLDLQLKQSQLKTDALQRSNIASEISNRNKPKAPNTQVVDVNGQKVLINSDTGETIKTISAGANSTNPQNLALTKANVDQVSHVLTLLPKSNAVGPNKLSRLDLGSVFSGAKGNFISDVKQITDQLSLDSLERAKKNGATFGALSEGELNVLANSASKLNSWAIKDKQGNISGYATTRPEFQKELDKINNFSKLDYILKGGSPSDVNVQTMPDGTHWTKNSDGSLTQL
jgi:hypothetical protein